MKIELVEHWKIVYKLWSVRLTVIGTAIAGFFIAYPDAFIHVWLSLPQDLKETLPPEVVKFLPIIILAISPIATAVKQNKLSKVKEDDAPKS